MQRHEKIKITMFHLSSSGSNNYYLFQAASDELRSKYDIELLTMEQAKNSRYIDHSDVYITTHGEYLSDYDKVNIDLWHGFPLKGMAKMDKQESTPDEHIVQHWAKKDMIMSYSALYNTAMNACNGANIAQYKITGLPRNDALFSPNSKANFNRIFPGLNINQEKIIFFMPTFRQSIMTPGKMEGGKNTQNFFGLSSFDKQALISFLDEHGITLVVKLHPFEESFFAKELKEFGLQRILVLNDSHLSTAQMDLYDVLGAADMLITDYSSVYIDFLLLDRPVLFVPTDLDEYRENRGLLLEPYEFWTPGPKIYSQEALHQAIARFISEPESFAAERTMIRNLCHYYQDNKASERIWGLIDKYIQDNMTVILERRDTFNSHKQLQNQIKQKIQEMIQQEQLAQANEAINRYLEANSADPDIFAMNGMLHLLTGNPKEAINSFEKGHNHFPWDEDLLYNLGYVYEMINDNNNAIKYYLEAQQKTSRPEMTALLQERLAALSNEY